MALKARFLQVESADGKVNKFKALENNDGSTFETFARNKTSTVDANIKHKDSMLFAVTYAKNF